VLGIRELKEELNNAKTVLAQLQRERTAGFDPPLAK
jgi:hypothetical protein